jgi:hypothetical protein
LLLEMVFLKRGAVAEPLLLELARSFCFRASAAGAVSAAELNQMV